MVMCSKKTGKEHPKKIGQGERGATLVEYAITTAVMMALLGPAAIFVTNAVQRRVINAEQIHDGWCIPDPVDAAIAALCR
jgi:hypothetical protein